jgi:hypothetical protein
MTGRFASVVLGATITISLGSIVSLVSTIALDVPVLAAAKAPADGRSRLKDIRTVAGRIKKTSLEVINDVTQRKLEDQGDPIFFEPSDLQVDKNPQLWSKEVSNLGAVEAPRKSWLDADVKHLEHWVSALNDDINAQSANQNATSGPWQDMQLVAKEMNEHLAQLKTLAQGPTYDNLAIARQALVIQEDLKKLETPWTEALKQEKIK